MMMLGTSAAVPIPLTDTAMEDASASLLGMSKLSANESVPVGAKRTVRVQLPAGAMV
jgi:hypothetical protein